MATSTITSRLPAGALSGSVTLSVVIPLLNERSSISELFQELQEALKNLSLAHGYEVIFVDDGSTDGSIDVLRELVGRCPEVQVIQFRRNFGKSAALAAGFRMARGDYVVTMDADLQDVPAEIESLLAPLLRDEADLVSGWKTPRQDPLTKTLPSTIFNRVVRAVTGIPLHDFNCGYKAYRREVLDEIVLYGEMHRYIPVLAHFRGFRVAEVPVRHRARQHGSSKFGIERYLRGFFDLLTVLFLNHYTRRPLHLFGWIGLLTFGTGFLIDLYLAILKVAFGEPLSNRPLLILGVLLMVIGLLVVIFGLLGEMIAYQTRVNRRSDDGPAYDYSVRRIIRHEHDPDA